MKMSVTEEVLKILEENRDSFVSGNDISEKLFVSRNAVWKAVSALKERGYDITAVTNKGYRLMPCNDIVSPQSIKKYLNRNLDIIVLDEIDSTNNYLKKLASDGAAEGTVVVSKKQTSGKGRLGKSFFSPVGTGIYFSVLLRPQISAEKSLYLTVMAAVAVAESVMQYADGDIKIKWVNDVYKDGKKLCGILTEGSVSLENNGLDYAVVGIGINVIEPKDGFPEDIKNTASSVFRGNNVINDAKSRITADVINRFFDMYHGEDTDYVKRYKAYSFLTGKMINIIRPDGIEPAEVLGITDECRLKVKKESGEITEISTGDVSVRAL